MDACGIEIVSNDVVLAIIASPWLRSRNVKKLYRKTTVDCVSHIVEVVKKSSSAGLNKAQCYENGKGFQYLDLNSVL